MDIDKEILARMGEVPESVRMDRMRALQVAVYVAVGGGMLGSAAAHRPGDFYIDSRVGKGPTKRKKSRR